MSALETFIRNVNWGKLDVLVIDMPPGTGQDDNTIDIAAPSGSDVLLIAEHAAGDAQITIGQRLALSGAVIVSTPQVHRLLSTHLLCFQAITAYLMPTHRALLDAADEADERLASGQDIALLDARRGATMFRKISVPNLGIVENMSYHQCRQCGHKEYVFGQDGAVRTAEELGMELLGQVQCSRTRS